MIGLLWMMMNIFDLEGKANNFWRSPNWAVLGKALLVTDIHGLVFKDTHNFINQTSTGYSPSMSYTRT